MLVKTAIADSVTIISLAIAKAGIIPQLGRRGPMDQTLFIFWEIVGLAAFYFGWKTKDIGYVFLIFAAVIFQMLTAAAWNITRDFPQVLNNTMSTTYTIHYVDQSAAYINVFLMYIAVLFFILRLLEDLYILMSQANWDPLKRRGAFERNYKR